MEVNFENTSVSFFDELSAEAFEKEETKEILEQVNSSSSAKSNNKNALEMATQRAIQQPNIQIALQNFDEQAYIDQKLGLIKAQLAEYYAIHEKGISSDYRNSLKNAQATFLYNRGTPEALATLDNLHLWSWL